jgi:hypothetical protein
MKDGTARPGQSVSTCWFAERRVNVSGALDHAVFQPALQVMVEAGYDRSIPFGDPRIR